MGRIRRTSLRALWPLLPAVVAALAAVSPAAADPEKIGYPNSMASTGDSITRAFGTFPCTLSDCPANSWSTGANAAINSHYNRILAANSLISGANFNDAVSGARMINLNSQVLSVNARNVDYVTILMGANDVCTGSEMSMTSVVTFLSQFQTAMSALTAGSPDARIFVVSIPNIYNLWSILHTEPAAVAAWSTGICQSMLANPTSMAQVDVDRRARVLQRNIDFNTQLQQVCAQYIHCRFDNNASFDWDFTPADVSTLDFFHPNLSGQTLAASVSYGITFDFTDTVAPATSASASPAAGGANVSLAATDDVGVSGIEYRFGAGAWVRYAAPVFVATGSTITYRAVDVNGNIEATSAYPAAVGGIAVAPDVSELPLAADAADDARGHGFAVGAAVVLAVAGLGARSVRTRRRHLRRISFRVPV